LRPLLDLPHLQFVSLQQEIGEEDAQVLRGQRELQAGGPFRDFAATAALIARVVQEVQPELTRLMAAFKEIEVVAHGRPLPEFDVQCPLMSLPLAFRTELSTIPADVPYIVPPAQDVAALSKIDWRVRLPGRKPLVGLVWAGDPLHKNDINRSMRLATLRPLLDLPHLQFVSLQQEICAQDAEVLHRHPGLLTGAPFRDFAQTAAAVARLDAVIAVDTAVAHLAGAMGKPLFLLLPFGADFRWLRERADSPWYPSARLFRQHAFDDWGRAVDALRQELMRWDSGRAARPDTPSAAPPRQKSA
jgi:hypothetical protein